MLVSVFVFPLVLRHTFLADRIVKVRGPSQLIVVTVAEMPVSFAIFEVVGRKTAQVIPLETIFRLSLTTKNCQLKRSNVWGKKASSE